MASTKAVHSPTAALRRAIIDADNRIRQRAPGAHWLAQVTAAEESCPFSSAPLVNEADLREQYGTALDCCSHCTENGSAGGGRVPSAAVLLGTR